MSDFNTISILGRIVKKLEIKTLSSGKKLLQFSIANNDYNKKGHFFQVKVWEKLASNIYKFFKKGDPIILTGRLVQETWETEDGTKSKIIIIASNFSFVPGQKKTGEKEEEETGDDAPDNNNDVPF